MNDMNKDTYTLWIDDELVATRDHTREGLCSREPCQ